MASDDLASNICQALPDGAAADANGMEKWRSIQAWASVDSVGAATEWASESRGLPTAGTDG
jgi:hypothetical protein